MTPSAPYEESKFWGSGRSMVARLKLKGIDGRALPGVLLAGFLDFLEKTHQVKTRQGFTDSQLFTRFQYGGAWPFFVDVVIFWLIPFAHET